MNIQDFTGHPEVHHLIRQLEKDGINERVFSDVVDTNGNQYVELVQEGGGVLGVALIGYTYVLEQMGLRFFSLAGTSAGSINALLLAALGDISQLKYEKLIDILANKDLYDFVDGDSDAKDFIETIVKKGRRVKLVWKGMQVIDNIFDDLGLNPGNNFLQWLTNILKDNSIETTDDLLKQFCTIPEGLKIRTGIEKTMEGLTPRLAFIASDITTETKVEFPKMRSLYWENSENTNPALFVRASMSIPYFFEPMIVSNLPSGPEATSRWYDLAGFRGEIPEEVHFVDGGMMSNFPIDIFHKHNTVPRLPTFGVKLGEDRNKANTISSPLNLFGAMFNAMRHLHDYDFILRNPDYRLLVKHIDIGHHDWLNFNLSEEDKIDLFRRGAVAAGQFLRSFDWPKYKKLRSGE